MPKAPVMCSIMTLRLKAILIVASSLHALLQPRALNPNPNRQRKLVGSIYGRSSTSGYTPMFHLQHKDFSEELAPNLTISERLESAMKRSKARKERIEAMVAEAGLGRYVRSARHRDEGRLYSEQAAINGGSSITASSGGFSMEMLAGDGAVMTSFYIGTPARKVRAIMDTGSDLVWQQCMPCQYCYMQPEQPIFDPARSSTFRNSSCTDKLCQELLTGTSCRGHNGSCQYTYMYGDTSYTSGELGYDTLSLWDAQGQDLLKLEDFAFGCGYENRGASFKGADGLLGMGQGPLSLPSQLSSPTFSYCLAPFRSKYSSPLLLGEYASTLLHLHKGSPIQVTPIVANSLMPTFYYLNLIGLSLNGVHLNISKEALSLKANGTGGLIVDSGTTITYLEEEVYQVVLNALQIELKSMYMAKIPRPMFGLEMCFFSLMKKALLPTLSLHFDGATMDLPPSNLFVDIAGVYCLALGASHGISILGNVQQQNHHILYDRTNQQFAFTRASCDQVLT